MGKYDVRSDFEIGGAVSSVHGSEEKYRTDINLRSGGQLRDFYLELRPAEGKSGWFDTATLRGQGFGGVDPFETARFTLRRNNLFDFRVNYAKDNYYFSVPDFALGLHSDDNIRRNVGLGLDLYLHPTFKLRMGYSTIKRSGNSFTSSDIFNDVFRLLVFNRNRTDDYRVGFDWQPSAFGVSFDQSFRSFRYDNQRSNVTPDQPGLTPPGVLLSDYSKDLPTRGRFPVSALTLKYRPSGRFDALARYEYSKGNVDFTRSELQSLRINPGNMSLEHLALTEASSNQQSHHRLDANASWSILPQLAFHNSANLNRYDIQSDQLTNEIFRNPTTGAGFEGNSADSRFMHYRRFSNDASLEFDVTRIWGAFGGYRYANREVEFRKNLVDMTELNTRNSTALQSVYTGVSASSGRRWNASLEFEHGWANNALLRIEPLRFNRWTARTTFRPGAGLQVTGSVGIRDDNNDRPESNYEFDNREFAVQFRWLPKTNYIFELGYGRMDILSATDIFFFLAGPQQALSRYVTNTNFGNVYAQFPLNKRVAAHLGYRLLDDSCGTFPLVFHQTDTGLSFNVSSGVWLNLGWKYYAYNEDLYSQQDYIGHLVSISMRFGL